MFKLAIISTLLWLVIFTFRIIQIGGLDPTYKDPENELLQPLRESLSAKIEASLPFPQSALLSGIILGTQKSIPLSLKNKLKDTGTIHMVVVSGQNLSLVAGFLMSLVSVIGRRKTYLFASLAIIFYSLLTGLGVPVIRAVVMVLLTYLAQLLGREKTGWWVLFLTAGAMLLYQPNWLLNLSFLLSFSATFGVVVIAPQILGYLKAVPRVLREDLAISMAAYFMTLPLIAYNFGNISLAAILVNSLILWSIPVVMIAGFITVAVLLVNNLAGQIIGLVPGVLLTYFIYIVDLFGDLSWVSINVGQTVWWMWVGYYLVLGGVIWLIKECQSSKIQMLNQGQRINVK